MTEDERARDDRTTPRHAGPSSRDPGSAPGAPAGGQAAASPVLGRPADFEPTVKMTALDIPPGPNEQARANRPGDTAPGQQQGPTARAAQTNGQSPAPTPPRVASGPLPVPGGAITSSGPLGSRPGGSPADPGPGGSGAGQQGQRSGPPRGDVRQGPSHQPHQQSHGQRQPQGQPAPTSSPDYYGARPRRHDPDGPNWTRLAAAAVFLAVIGVGIALVVRLGSGDGSGRPGGEEAIPNPSVNDMALATVHILGLGDDGQPLCSGSGTIVESSGMILTNAHVVTRDTVCDFSTIGIAVTTDSGRPPELLYEADVLVSDPAVDLAIIKIARTRDPAGTLPESFPFLGLGDSDDLMIGDNIRILGYPEIGGETITFTNGSVSGFTAQAGIGDRALIKTDATIAGGNSGGAAVNSVGELIGIPTKARASESGPAVDCRPLADTNGDGAVDGSDNCVPIGGFLNGIRPINLASDLLAQAGQATPQPLARETAVQVDLSTVKVTNPRFSLGEAENSPSEVVLTATAGVNELCLFVDWSGIPDGAEWDGLWYRDKEVVEEYSLVKQTWKFGPDGSNFWMCAIDEQAGLPAGLYELGFFLNGDLVFAEGIVLSTTPTDVITTTWENTTDVDICGLAVNPEGSGPVGLNELDAGTTIPPGQSIDLDLPRGLVVVEAYDCDGRAIADSTDKVIDINGQSIYTISAPGG